MPRAASAGPVAVTNGAPGRAFGVSLDVSDPDAWLRLRARIESEFGGGVTGFINNAGITSRARLPDVELEEWTVLLAGRTRLGRCLG